MRTKKPTKQQRVCLVTVDMGYGHQRAAFPLRFLAKDAKIILANNYPGIPAKDKAIWNQGRKPYEFISRAKHIPGLGDLLFWGMDQMQRISDFYPRRSLVRPSLQLRTNLYMIRKNEWGRDLIERLDKENLPLLTTFFTIAYMAEEFGYRQDIYLVVCDADVSRAWAAANSRKSKIKYLVPTKRVYERLQLYGVPRENIFLTGFPLDKRNLGGLNLDILRADLAVRLRNLDPANRYINKYKSTIRQYLGEYRVPDKPQRPLAISFAVGGAGAQRETGAKIIKSFRRFIERGEVEINLVAGIHKEVRDYFIKQAEKNNLKQKINKGLNIIYEPQRLKYFAKFNDLMRRTDVLWTKPSELSFYVALGLPIIMSEPLGSQEKFNRKWLINLGAGLDQEKIKYADEWLMDWIDSGWLAEAAMQGFLEAPKYGVYNIERVLNNQLPLLKESDIILQY